MQTFTATIEIKNGQIYITPDDNYIEFENFISDNRDKTLFEAVNVLPF